MSHLPTRLRPLLAAALATGLIACTARIDTQGYIPPDHLVAKIKIGVDGTREVADILGTAPSSRTISVDKSTTWYYIMRRTKTESFFDQEVLDQRVLAVDFDQSGVVRGFRHYNLADGRGIELVERVTPTRGRKLGFLEQMFGNLGRLGGQVAEPP